MSAIKLCSIGGHFSINSRKVPWGPIRLIKPLMWVRQQEVKDCWSCNGNQYHNDVWDVGPKRKLTMAKRSV